MQRKLRKLDVMKKFLSAFFVSLCAASAVAAATINESDVPGGFGSNSQWFNPTYTSISYGVDVVTGTATSNNFDFLRFTDLDAGAQSITFDFAVPNATGTVFTNGGGQVYYSETYQSGPYNGTNAGGFNMFYNPFNAFSTTTASLTFNLANSFAGGDLFVNILPQYGQFTYSVSLTGNGGLPAPVPVPAAGALMLAALGGLAFRRRRALHPVPAQVT